MTVKEARVKKGLTQVELAAKADVSLLTICKLEKDQIEKMSVGKIMKICKALDYDVASLFCSK